MRGIIAFFVLVFTLAVIFLLAPAYVAVEEAVLSFDAVSNNYSGTISTLSAAVWRWVPLVAIFVSIVSGVIYYVRKDRRVRRVRR